ncbi:MAG TPA: ADP-ribosylglycohydrolase family protein [Candidatus Paceibacterota bacterium]|nr:ADP-ribosylglycohydrolase family protein [Candidatus Paceibacterota bacterium]
MRLGDSPVRDQVRGMFLGVAIGDALGVPVETYDAGRIRTEFGRITDYRQNPTHKWSSEKPAGMWSDDTQLTLAVAESIIETGRLDLENQAKWHLVLLDEFGDLGLGGSTRDALRRLREGEKPTESGISNNPKRGMGNALPMKVAPVGLYLASPGPWDGPRQSWEGLEHDIIALAHMTHGTDVGGMSAVAHASAIALCLTFSSRRHSGLIGRYLVSEIVETLDGVPDFGPVSHHGQELYWRLEGLNAFKTMLPFVTPQAWDATLGGDRFHVNFTLPFCYGMFLRNPDSVETLYDTISAGGDTDTNASIVGGMLGAVHGAALFPEHLVAGLAHRERILDTAERLCARLGIKE